MLERCNVKPKAINSFFPPTTLMRNTVTDTSFDFGVCTTYYSYMTTMRSSDGRSRKVRQTEETHRVLVRIAGFAGSEVVVITPRETPGGNLSGKYSARNGVRSFWNSDDLEEIKPANQFVDDYFKVFTSSSEALKHYTISANLEKFYALYKEAPTIEYVFHPEGVFIVADASSIAPKFSLFRTIAEQKKGRQAIEALVYETVCKNFSAIFSAVEIAKACSPSLPNNRIRWPNPHFS